MAKNTHDWLVALARPSHPLPTPLAAPSAPWSDAPTDVEQPRGAKPAADRVLLRDETDHDLLLVVEVQLRIDPRKKWRWPLYLFSHRDKHRRPAYLVVIAPSVHVASWARAVLEALDPTHCWHRVIGPEQIPRWSDIPDSQRTPEQICWSVAMHVRRTKDLPPMDVLFSSSFQYVDAFADVFEYTECLLALLRPSVRSALEDAMKKLRLSEQTESPALARILRHWEAQLDAASQEKGRAVGLAEGRAEGRAEGLAEGEVVGRARAENDWLNLLRQNVIEQIHQLGLALSQEIGEQIQNCCDARQLLEWTRRLPFATSLDDCFGGSLLVARDSAITRLGDKGPEHEPISVACTPTNDPLAAMPEIKKSEQPIPVQPIETPIERTDHRRTRSLPSRRVPQSAHAAGRARASRRG